MSIFAAHLFVQGGVSPYRGYVLIVFDPMAFGCYSLN